MINKGKNSIRNSFNIWIRTDSFNSGSRVRQCESSRILIFDVLLENSSYEKPVESFAFAVGAVKSCARVPKNKVGSCDEEQCDVSPCAIIILLSNSSHEPAEAWMIMLARVQEKKTGRTA